MNLVQAVAPALSGNPYGDHESREGLLVGTLGGHHARNAPDDTCIPIDMRQASRGATMTNNRTDGGAPGTGIGEDGDPCPILAHSHVPAVAYAMNAGRDGYNDGSDQTYVPIVFAQNSRDEVRELGGNIAGALSAQPGMKQQTYVAFKKSQSGVRTGDVHARLDSHKGSRRMEGVLSGYGVRRLMPIECERCQGMPDDWTRYGITEDGKEVELSDSARYRLIGNSVAIPTVEWIGRRIMDN